LKTNPITYKLVEYDETTIEGSFYEQELQNTQTSIIFQLDAVLKSRTRKGVKEHYVHWFGWDKKYDYNFTTTIVVVKFYSNRGIKTRTHHTRSISSFRESAGVTFFSSSLGVWQEPSRQEPGNEPGGQHSQKDYL
jgi:hypothetical protein